MCLVAAVPVGMGVTTQKEDRRAQLDDLAETEFDRWIIGLDNTFQSLITPEIARHRLEGLLDQQIVFIDQTCGLTEDQANKLRLAGRADFESLVLQANLEKPIL